MVENLFRFKSPIWNWNLELTLISIVQLDIFRMLIFFVYSRSIFLYCFFGNGKNVQIFIHNGVTMILKTTYSNQFLFVKLLGKWKKFSVFNQKKRKKRKKIVKFGLKIENGYLSSKAQITIWYNYFSIFLVCNWRNCPLTKSIFDYLLLYLMVLNKSLLCFTKHEVEINDAEKCRQRQPEQNWKS